MNRVRHEKGAVFLIIILVLIIIMSLVLYFSLQTDPVSDVLNKQNDQLLNVLFVLEDEGKPLFTDLLLYYPKSQRGALFCIPGDTGLIIQSLGRMDKIEAVYKEKGMAAYKKEIEKLTDSKIPFTIEINLNDFALLTDYLGGMNVFIPSPVDVESDKGRYLLPSGAVNLDGDKIVVYARCALPDDNDDNVRERMQNIAVSFLSALNVKSDFVLKKDVFPVLSKFMHANIDNESLFRLITMISDINAERLDPQYVTGQYRIMNGQRLLFPDWDGQLIKDVINQTKNSIASVGSIGYSRVYVLEILNGTTIQNLASNAAGLMKSFGYDVLNVGNADTQNYQKTLIIDHIGDADIAEALGQIIKCDNIETEEISTSAEMNDADSLVDFTIILGRDFSNGRYVR